MSREQKHAASSRTDSFKGIWPPHFPPHHPRCSSGSLELDKAEMRVRSLQTFQWASPDRTLWATGLPGLGSHCCVRGWGGQGIPRCPVSRPCSHPRQSLPANALKALSIWFLWAAGNGDICLQSGGFPHFLTEVFILPFEKSLIFKYSPTQNLTDSLKKIIYDQVFKINEGDFLLHFSRLDNDEKPPSSSCGWGRAGYLQAHSQPGLVSHHTQKQHCCPLLSLFLGDNVGKEKKKKKHVWMHHTNCISSPKSDKVNSTRLLGKVIVSPFPSFLVPGFC